MADNLPLIPDKEGTLCADVRPVLREVFRELDSLPPLQLPVARSGAQLNNWAEKYASECKEIWKREVELRDEYANRISREPLPNVYKISSPKSSKTEDPEWRRERGVVNRKDLVPTIDQNAGRDASLWIKNILNRSSGELTPVELRGTQLYQPIHLSSQIDDSLLSLSTGEAAARPEARPRPPPSPRPPPQPECVLCVPPELHFVNFTVGQLYTQSVRLVNVSKFEIRLSLRPPRRRELDVELSGPRGLTVTSGSAADLKVHFRPRDVRDLRDVLHVRVSIGKSFAVPIACYMQPPLLHILAPSVSCAALSYSPGDGSRCEATSRSSDVLELGARLLGDVHSVRLLLHCDAEHASFFILPEDSWLSFSLDGLTSDGSVVSGGFALCPAWWRGGGAARGCAWCLAPRAGLHSTTFRLLCSTAVVRPLNLIADSLLFSPDHLTIEAQEKDYDICSEDDPGCEYYVHLGTAFPGQPLSATVQLLNRSPITYSYYWSVRPWGVCSCWAEEWDLDGAFGPEDDERLCGGAMAAKETAGKGVWESAADEAARALRVEAAFGPLAPRSSRATRVRVPDAGRALRVHRAVLMLILKDIPKESFPPNYNPMVVRTKTVAPEAVPGMQVGPHEVCEVVCCQLEVWWEVAPVRFALDPCVLPLFHSRRVQSVNVAIRATQLFGCEPIDAQWRLPDELPAIGPARLAPSHSCPVSLHIPLPSLPNDCPATVVITLSDANDEWESRCLLRRQCATRYPALRPARLWLGVVRPGDHLHTTIDVINDTHQEICWWSEGFRWWGENVPSPACIGRPPCEACQERICSCALLRPTRGTLKHGDATIIHYGVNAPDRDGCVATLVQVRRSGADVARAALVAHRVLAPVLVMRVLACGGGSTGCCDGGAPADGCTLERGAVGGARGAASLRPLGALALGRRTCYRLRFTNLTPLPTSVHWDTPIESKDFLHVMFLPSHFNVKGYGEVEIRVVVEARKVCGRRAFVYRAQVANARRPLYLLVDAAVAGLEITCEIPLGDHFKTDSFVVMRRTQREEYPWEAGMGRPSSPHEIFAQEDRKRATIKENICRCKYKMVYIPPKKPLRPPPTGAEDYPPIEIVHEPPPLTRVCLCTACQKPTLPEENSPCCLQFRNLPMKTVRSRTLTLRNHSVLTARWSTAIRRWPRHHNRTINTDQWAGDVREPGVVLQCTPPSGVLAANAHTRIDVQVYADCWGLFHDQILIKLAHIDPIVLDVWIEAVGPPLQFAINPTDHYLDVSPILWVSASDPERTLHTKNVSRTELNVQAYVFTENEHVQDVKPFRLYLRFYDIPTRTCPCVDKYDELAGEQSSLSGHSSYTEEMDTCIEIYLAPDYGVQGDTCFKVSPDETTIAAGEWKEWKVSLKTLPHYELGSSCNLVLRVQPKDRRGEIWYRPDPPAQIVGLKQAVREGLLKASCRDVRVELCALDLPHEDVMRVRKRFRLQNIGNGPLAITSCTRAPWTIVLNKQQRLLCGVGCVCIDEEHVEDERREAMVTLHLEPRSSIEICVEVRVDTSVSWPVEVDTAGPCQRPDYPQFKKTKTPLVFYDDDNVLLKLPLILELEYPKLVVEPEAIDFGFVTDGDTRKTYFTVTHSSRKVTLDVGTEWVGAMGFKIWPPFLHLPPNAKDRVYVQYTSAWSAAPAEGCVLVRVGCGCSQESGWCRASVACRASPSRDHKCRATRHDHTDDTNLLPPHLTF